MNKEIVKTSNFSENEFIRLYCAINFKKQLPPIIKHEELEKELYKFYFYPDFEKLFQDISLKRDYANPEYSYLDLGRAINVAQIYGLLIPVHDVGEVKSIISCNKKLAEKIISTTDAEMVKKMNDLFDMMFNLTENKEDQQLIMIKKNRL